MAVCSCVWVPVEAGGEGGVRSVGAGIIGSCPLSVLSTQTQHQVLWESSHCSVLVSFCVKLGEPRVTWGEGTSKEGLPQLD